MRKTTIGLCALGLLAACTKPADVSKPISTTTDSNVKMDVIPTPTGFTVDVRYSRYQFMPEANALITACRSIVLTRAKEEGERQGKAIVPIDEQAIRVSTGRNIINARTSCRAFAEVQWKP